LSASPPAKKTAGPIEKETLALLSLSKSASLNSEATGSAGENLKGSTVTARACLMGANLIDAGGL
jgi:hypothetical protein